MAGIRAMNTQMAIGHEISQKVQQQTLHAVQSQGINSGHTRQVRGRKGLATGQRTTASGEAPETLTFTRETRIVAARRSGVCLNPWICQRFRTGGFPWPGCDREQCRCIGMPQKASRGLNLPHLLAGYRVSMSISAQLRPQCVMAPFDLRIVIIMSKHPNKGMILPHCYELHPSDVYDNGRSDLGCALHHRNFVVLEILISLWENYLLRHGVDRRLFFGAHQLLEGSRTTKHEEHILKKLIGYTDNDIIVTTTALHRAIEDEDMHAVLEALCAEPSIVNVPNLKGEPPIHLAVRTGSESVPMLLALRDAQADIGKRDTNERTPLMSAALAGNVEAVIWLMQQQPAAHQDQDIDGNSALNLAAMSEAPSSVEVMAKLLGEGAHHSPRNRTRSVPLHRLRLCQVDYSVCRRKIELLLEAGADLDARDKLERTPLMDALLVQNTAVTRALIDAGAPINSVDYFGAGALHEAAFRCAADTLRELSRHETFCRAGVDVLAADSGGHSPWDCFVYSLQVPTESVSRLGHASEDRCRAFEDFYVQVRDFKIQSEIDALARVRDMLRAKNDDRASRELMALAVRKEPRELWATGVVMQTLRSINLLIRQGDADAAREALEERMELLREEQGKSPWAYESI